MSTVWISLGSNVGDREKHIDRAVSSLARILEELRVSPIYETGARDVPDQRDFLNAVVRGTTGRSAPDLLVLLQGIERAGGRVRDAAVPRGPRTIDLDILLIDDCVLDETGGSFGLTVPHPRMDERLFVLKPLLDLDPGITDPRDGIPWAGKASHLSDQRVKLYRT